MSFVREFLAFIMVRKKFWLLPIMVMPVVFGRSGTRHSRMKPWLSSIRKLLD